MTTRLLADGTESEEAFQTWLHQRTKQVEGLVVQYHTYNAMRSDTGFPDYWMVKEPPQTPGGRGYYRLVVAELKSAKGKVKVSQAKWLDSLSTKPGVEVYLWRPADREEIERILESPDPIVFSATTWMARRAQEKLAPDPKPTRRRSPRSRTSWLDLNIA